MPAEPEIRDGRRGKVTAFHPEAPQHHKTTPLQDLPQGAVQLVRKAGQWKRLGADLLHRQPGCPEVSDGRIDLGQVAGIELPDPVSPAREVRPVPGGGPVNRTGRQRRRLDK